ncbi:FAD/NAD(P)-binding domain-containing protein [Cubamyces sp. BRFM 1775]|nr:FAD/NAD(P)-binding domain-containing protein [Cubamyces sp. BRFM 1775]
MAHIDLKHVVIVGGGVAGALAARSLSKKLDPTRHTLTLINSRPCFIHLTASARMVVTPEGHLEDRAIVPLDRLFQHGIGTLKVGRATFIVETAPGKGGVVVLKDGERIPYSALVLALGNSWPGPLHFPDSVQDLRAHINEWRSKFERSKHVVVVGGGAVGIETAGEVKHEWPAKHVTLVHSDDMLLNDAYPEKFRRALERRVRAGGINVILQDRVATPPEGTIGITTTKGIRLDDADLVVQAYGSRPDTELVATLDREAVTPQGHVRVSKNLGIPGHPGIFAAGDIIDWPEQKQAHKAVEHVPVVVANVLSYLEGKALREEYKGSPETIVIPVGKDGGSGYVDLVGGIRVVVGDMIVRKVKAKDLSVDRARETLGYKR